MGKNAVPVPVVEIERLRSENERLRSAIGLHHERIKTLGINDHRGVPQWGGPWDHQLWATVDLPSGPHSVDASQGERAHSGKQQA